MSFILDFLFPRRCYGCGRPGQYFCPQCTANLIYRPVKPDYPQGFSGTLSLFPYRGLIKSAVGDLKFKFVSDLVPELSLLIVSALQSQYSHLLAYWQQHNFTLIPVPLHPSRSRWRGFNQSELVCREIASKLKLKCEPNILIRTKNTLPQTKIKDKLLRRSNLTQAFKFNNKTTPIFQGGVPEGQGGLDHIILFDDVATTGSTLISALSAFPKNTESWALTIAG
jgi:ComF family protein